MDKIMFQSENYCADQNDRLRAYYDMNRKHLQWSFIASLFALFVGLLAIISGIKSVLSGQSETTSAITTAGGVITQFIGAGFFWLYTKNLKQLNIFYEKLIKLQDTERAVEISNLLPETERNKSLSSIANILITRNEPRLDLSPEYLLALKELNTHEK